MELVARDENYDKIRHVFLLTTNEPLEYLDKFC